MRAMPSACDVGQGFEASLPSIARRSPAAEPAPAGGLMFDMADVLYDDTRWRRWLLRLVNQLGVRVDYVDFFRAWDHDYLVDVNCGRREVAEALQAFLLASGVSWAQVDEVEAASRVQRQGFQLNVRPLPGVVSTIAQLCQWRLPLVAWADSTQTAAKLAERVERLSLAKRFQAVLSSFDLECAQPSPQCYQAALDVLGLSAPQVVYVGHDAEHLAAAKAAGLRTVAFNFQRPARADHYLTRFEDLLEVVNPCAQQQQHVNAGQGGAIPAWRSSTLALSEGNPR
jgi:FMN phosphatase YigB (HAD superfamily)